MTPNSFMFIAGETSGDILAAELVHALKEELTTPARVSSHKLQFYGAGGARMAEAGVTLVFDLTEHSVIGLWEAVRRYGKFKKLLERLVELAFERRPDIIICVDFSGFNRRLARRIRWELEVRHATHANWKPKIVQYVSPQVWASRPGRAKAMARDYDLLLSIFPFEKKWYAERVSSLSVEFVGHPIVERHGSSQFLVSDSGFGVARREAPAEGRRDTVLLLPGSRVGELKRHLPVMFGALRQILEAKPDLKSRMVLPNESLAALAKSFEWPAGLEVQIGGLEKALAEASVAIASTGTVTLECAFFGLPTVAMYCTSRSTYEIGRRIIQVKYLAMPNLLANEAIYPELIQHDATPEKIAKETLDLLNNVERRKAMSAKLAKVVESLGAKGASQRAAKAILANFSRS